MRPASRLQNACLRTADLNHWGVTHVLYALRALPAFAVAQRETWGRFREELGWRGRVGQRQIVCPGHHANTGAGSNQR